MSSLDLKINIYCFIVSMLITLKSVHIMQLNSYNIDQQIVWYKKNWKNFISNIVLFISNIFLIIGFYSIRNYNLFYFICMASTFMVVLSSLVVLIENLPRKEKKKLIFTKRAIRLIVCNVIIFLLLMYLSILGIKENSSPFMQALLYIAYVIAPIINFISLLIMAPIENKIRAKFKNKSKLALMAHKNLHKIAVTGSFGKTSVKHFLCEVLKEKYNVTMTPGSYNTPMGVALTIKNDLKNTDEIFITEFGARRIGDVKELSEFVEPDSCIISEVGNQHLDTFHNVENVLNTKFEVVDFILNKPYTNDSFILVNGDNELIKKKIKKYEDDNALNGHKIYTFGENADNDFYVINIKVNRAGREFLTNFDVVLKDKSIINHKYFENGNDVLSFSTSLIGKHNILNLLSSVAMGLLFNVDYKDICFSLKRIEQVEHRLELKNINEDVIMVDDAYNSNPIGAKNAVLLLNDFNDYKKIIITPGMVELGFRQYEENKLFGECIAENLDYAFVVGKTNKNAIMDGLNNGNSKLIDKYYFDTFNAAFESAMKNIEGKKIILIENDLPDNY